MLELNSLKLKRKMTGKGIDLAVTSANANARGRGLQPLLSMMMMMMVKIINLKSARFYQSSVKPGRRMPRERRMLGRRMRRLLRRRL